VNSLRNREIVVNHCTERVETSVGGTQDVSDEDNRMTVNMNWWKVASISSLSLKNTVSDFIHFAG